LKGDEKDMNEITKEQAKHEKGLRRLHELTQHQAERIAELEKDAERYRWLRAQRWSSSQLVVVSEPKQAIKLGYDCPSGDRLDEASDAAIAGEKK
jgi:hypothetical protein